MKMNLIVFGTIVFGILFLPMPDAMAADSFQTAIDTMNAVAVISLILSIILFIAILLICYYTAKIKKLLEIMAEWQIEHNKQEWDKLDKPWRAFWEYEKPKSEKKKVEVKNGTPKVCRNCGTKNEGNPTFCRKCGYKLE